MAAKELSAIIAAHARASESGERAALATVVKTSGSTYRRAGARMWIGERGGVVGSISGGCLEDDARDRAQEVIASGKPAIIHYDTTAEGDILWGSGVGCQGVVHVLIEPLPSPTRAADGALDCLAAGLRGRDTSVLATVFRVENTTRAAAGEFLWYAGPAASAIHNGISDPPLAKSVAQAARDAWRGRAARVQTFALPDGGEIEIFFDVIPPPPALLIIGAGHDAVPLAHLAGELGWRVRVADRRRAYAKREVFPTAAEVVHCAACDVGMDRLPIETGEAVVAMTHSYLQDLAILRAVLPSGAGYIGVLGPSRRKELLLRELRRAPFGDESASASVGEPSWLKPASLRRLHGPAGLDIGAEAPEQIALSILAEIEAYAARRRGGSLKQRRRPLHDAIPKVVSADAPTGERKRVESATPAFLTAAP